MRRDYLLAVVRTAVDPCLLIRIWCVSVGRTFPLKPQDLADVPTAEYKETPRAEALTFSLGAGGMPGTRPADSGQFTNILRWLRLGRMTSPRLRGTNKSRREQWRLRSTRLRICLRIVVV